MWVWQMTQDHYTSTRILIVVGIVIIFAIVLYLILYGMMYLQYDQYQSCKLAIDNNSWHITQKVCDAYNIWGAK